MIWKQLDIQHLIQRRQCRGKNERRQHSKQIRPCLRKFSRHNRNKRTNEIFVKIFWIEPILICSTGPLPKIQCKMGKPTNCGWIQWVFGWHVQNRTCKWHRQTVLQQWLQFSCRIFYAGKIGCCDVNNQKQEKLWCKNHCFGNVPAQPSWTTQMIVET